MLEKRYLYARRVHIIEWELLNENDIKYYRMTLLD